MRAENELRGRRAKSSREDHLILQRQTELDEFQSIGMKLPDLRLPKMVEMLANWELELNLIPKFTMAFFKRPAPPASAEE